jgi:hypothetical protein
MIIPSFSAAMANAAPKATTCFVYGTLMSPDVLRELLGRVPGMRPRAVLSSYSRHPVLGRVYPGVVPAPPTGPDNAGGMPTTTTTNAVEGILLLDITPLEMRCLDWFEEEGVDYKRSNVQVTVPLRSFNENGQPNENNDRENSDVEIIETNAYIWLLGSSKLDLSCDWDYGMFLRKHLDWYLETTVKPCRVAMEKEIS